MISVRTIAQTLAVALFTLLQGQAADLYDEALHHASVSQFKEAHEKLQKFIEANPADARVMDARFHQAEMFLALGSILEASTVYETILAHQPTEEQEIRARLQIARCLEARGEFLRAITKYKEFVRRNRDSRDVHETWFYVARLYRHSLANFQDAERELLMLLAHAPKHEKNAAVLWELAELYRYNLNNIRRAQEVYAELYTQFPKDALAMPAMANSAYLLEEGGIHDWAKAVLEYRKYVETFPQAGDFYDRLARIAWIYRDRLNQYQNAIDYYDKAHALKPNPGVLWERAAAAQRTGKPEVSLEGYRLILEKYPDSKEAANAWLATARQLWDMGKRDESIQASEAMLQKMPGDVNAWWELSHRLREHKRWERAIEVYDHILNTWPTWNPGDVFVYKSWAYLNRHDDAKARAAAAAEANQAEAAAQAIAEAQKALEDSLAALQPVYTLWKGHADPSAKALYHQGYEIGFFRMKNYELAIKNFEQLIENWPDYVHWANRDYGLRWLCESHLAQSQSLDGAAEFLRKTLSKNPYSENLRNDIAELMRRYVERKEFQKAADLSPIVLSVRQTGYGEAWTLFHLADAYAGLAAEASPKETVPLLQEKQLQAYARLDAYRRDGNYGGIHGSIDQRRTSVIQPLLRAQSLIIENIAEARFKQDAEGDDDKDWVTAALDDSWKPLKVGQDWGNFDGFGWYAMDATASGGKEEYRISFTNVDDEMWLYVNGKLAGNHAGAGQAFSLSFDPEKTEGSFRLAIKVRDTGGAGGILGSMTLEKPKLVGEQEALNIALAKHALGRDVDALNDYQEWMKDLLPGNEKRDRVAPYQTWIYAAQNNIDRLAANVPVKPTVDYFILLGLVQERLGRHDQAEMAFKKGIQTDEQDRNALLSLAQFYERRSNWKEAHDAYLRVIDALKGGPEEGSFKAHVVWLTNDRWGNRGRARELIAKYLQEYPDSAYWNRLYADHLYDYDPRDANTNAAAITHYQKWFLMNQGLDPWHAGYRLWDLLVRTGNLAGAQGFCQIWANRFPNHPQKPDMLYRLAETRRLLGQQNEAEKVQALATFKQLQKESPNSGGTINAINNVVNNYPIADALEMINQWEKDNPRNDYTPTFLWPLGSRMESDKEFGVEKANELYRRVWNDYRWKWAENLYAFDRLGNHLWAQKKYDEAYALYDQVMNHFGGNGHGQIITAWHRSAYPYGNQVPFKTEVDSTHPQFDKARLTDEQTQGQQGHPSYTWASADGPEEHWVECLFSQPEEIRSMQVWWAHEGQLPRQVKLQYFDGQKYVDYPGHQEFLSPDNVFTSWTLPRVKAAKVRLLQKGSGGPQARPDTLQLAEVRLYRYVNDELWGRLEAHYRRMMRAYWHSGEHWNSGLAISNYLAWRQQFLDAHIELQKLLYALPANHGWFWDVAVAEAKARMDRQRFGEAAAIFRTLLNRHRGIDSQRRADAERLMGQCLTKSGEDYAAIDPNLPEAGLLWGNVFSRNGEEDLAWDRFEQNRALFPEHQHKLSFEYISLIAKRLLTRKETPLAIDICKQFLIKRREDRQVSHSERAQIQLIIGDAHFRDERYEIAREEYSTVLTLPEFRTLPEAIEGRFKVGSTMMAQKIFSKAEEIFTELTQHPHEDTVARAHLMLGILFHAQEERKKAEEKFKEVLALAPKSETADEIIYRLGIVFQEGKKYKEALDALRLIGAWGGESRKVVEPGRMLRIRLSDRDLTIARGAAEVPVIATTSSGDSERVLLSKSEVGRGLFVAEVETVLGTPTPNDRKLQVMGMDTITYNYDPQWAKDFKILDQDAPPPIITLAADATIKISPTEIKEEEEIRVNPDLFVPEEQKRKGYRLFRDEKQVKPGNNVYIRVIDTDQDISNNVDKIDSLAEASSGDTVIFPLTETEPHTGIFMGALPTGTRPPDALASDSTEGHEAFYAIDMDASAKSAWVGTLDARPPKWLRIDLKEVYSISKFDWTRGDGYDPKEDRQPIRYILEASRDKVTWFPLAEEPANQQLRIRGAVGLWDPDGAGHYSVTPASMLEGDGNTAQRWIGKDNQAEWIVDIDLGQVTEITRTILKNHDNQFEVRQYAIYTETLVGKYPGQDRDHDRWTLAYKSASLDKPKPDTADFTVPDQPQPGQRAQPLRARYIRLIISEAFQSHPEIGEFEIYPRLTFQMQKQAEGIGASFTFPAVEARFVRMTILEFHNDAPAIASVAVYDPEGRRLVPTGQNLHELAANTILELTPGDEITVTYKDQKNIHPGEPKSYRESLFATFYNGFTQAIVREWYEDQQGNRYAREHMVRRVRPGDRFIVQIVDYDEDKTDRTDKIPFTVTSSSGKVVGLEAMETDPYSGVFTKEVYTAADERPGSLQISEGGTLTISYLDAENTDPGNKVARAAMISVATPSHGKVRILPNMKINFVAKTAGESSEETQKLVTIEKDMEVEVVDSDMSLHSGNAVKVKLTTTSGAEVEIECSVLGGGQSIAFSGYRDYHKALNNALELGIFRGKIRVVLGDKSSPAQRVQATSFGEQEFDLGRGKKKKQEGPMIDVLNVMGGDTITARYLDESTPDNPLPTERYDSARILSDAEFGIFDDQFEKSVEYVHAGEKIYLQAMDPDMDRTGERDRVAVKLESTFDDGPADAVEVWLTETLSHSGLFTASIPITHEAKAVTGNEVLEANFGSRIRATYFDKFNTKSALDAVELNASVEVVTGSDGQLIAFSRRFPTDQMAVESQFRIGECFYYLGKDHVEMKQSETGLRELAEGQQILGELLIYHPESDMVDQIGYLLGNIAQEQNKWDDAVVTYRRITRDYPESIVAPDSQYKIAMCYEKKGEFDFACEEYVRLAYKYPDNPLVSDSMIRIGLYFFNKKKYEIALQVFLRFTSKFPEHASVQKVAFKTGLCYILNEQFIPGGEFFKSFVEKFPESDLKPAALYWAGDSFLKGGDPLRSYQMFKRCIWDFPDTKWAKYARGRLTAPIFDRIAEAE